VESLFYFSPIGRSGIFPLAGPMYFLTPYFFGARLRWFSSSACNLGCFFTGLGKSLSFVSHKTSSILLFGLTRLQGGSPWFASGLFPAFWLFSEDSFGISRYFLFFLAFFSTSTSRPVFGAPGPFQFFFVEHPLAIRP